MFRKFWRSAAGRNGRTQRTRSNDRPLSAKTTRTNKSGRTKSANSDASNHSHHSDSTSHHSLTSGDEESSSLISIKSGALECCRPGASVTRKWQMFQMIFLPFIPITALIVQNSTMLSTVVNNLKEAGEINGQGYLGAPIRTHRLYNKKSVRGYIALRTCHQFAEDEEEPRVSLNANGTADDTALDELIWYSIANDVILDLLSKRIRQTSSTGVWKPLIAYKNIIRSIENYSVSMVYGLYYYGKGSLSQDSFNKYVKFDALAEDYLNATKQFSAEVAGWWDSFVKSNEASGMFLEGLGARRAEIYRNSPLETKANTSLARSYFGNMTLYIAHLRTFQRRLRTRIREQIALEITSARTKQIVAAVLLAVVLGISPVIIILVRNVTSTIQTYSSELSSKTKGLKREQRKSDRLLRQMLPGDVIRQLRLKKQVPAEAFEFVTIYFSDIVQFTKISASSTPMEIVVMLNSLYKLFDSRIQHYDVYKVETIGDAYMVVSGLPKRNGNMHAGEICTMALDLVMGISTYEIPHRPGIGLQIRIGINTGPCVAGVVGTTMPRYCLFGDSINTASRMESNGEAMKIHITEDTKVVLDELDGFITESRGRIEIKGKGLMSTYWLIGKAGGIGRSVEMTTPGFFKSVDTTPEFLRELFGSGSSEEELTLPTLKQSIKDGLQVQGHYVSPTSATATAKSSICSNSKIPLSIIKQ